MFRLQNNNPLISQIRDTFYNDLVNLTLDLDGITEATVDKRIIEQIQGTIRNVIEASENENAILLPSGSVITKENCPNLYLPFLNALLGLLRLHEQIKQSPANDLLQQFNGAVESLANKIALMDQFKTMIPDVRQFILEAKGILPVPQHQLLPDDAPITPELIRKSFYNEMATQTFLAIQEGWVTTDDLEAQEAYLFFALPALTLIEAINQSKNCSGIRLLDDKVLVPKNCPSEEHFQELFLPILSKKIDLLASSDKELMVIKMLCMNKEIQMPQELAEYKTSRAVQCAVIINETASQISRRRVFKQTIQSVINFCLGALTEKPRNA